MDKFKAWVDLCEAEIRQMLFALIGHDFGDEPEKRLTDIRNSRKNLMEYAANLCNVTNNDVVLDLGSGCGFGTYWLAKRARQIYACDISPAYLSFASRECARLGNVAFHLIKSRHLDFLGKDSVDVICSISVFIHFNLYDIFWYFKEFCRVLKPGGRVFIDIADSDRLDFDHPGRYETYFLQHSEDYQKNPEGLAGLMQWNSVKSVVRIASHLGFQNTFKSTGEDSYLVFVKQL